MVMKYQFNHYETNKRIIKTKQPANKFHLKLNEKKQTAHWVLKLCENISKDEGNLLSRQWNKG